MDDVIRSVVARELGTTPAEVSRVDEGLLHDTYRVVCDGTMYVCQFESDADEDRVDALGRGLQCYRLLRDSDVPVPDPVTETVRTVDGRGYVLVAALPGESAERDVTPGRTRNAGRVLARIHEARRFEIPGWLRFEDGAPVVDPYPDGFESWHARTVAEAVERLRDGGLERAAAAVDRAVDRAAVRLTDFQPVLCHGDYSPDNVQFRDDEVTGVLDFDRARAGHHQRDLVAAANAFWMHDPCAEWDVRAAFYEGYREVAGLDGDFERTEPLFRVTTLADTVGGMLELGELSAYERDFYADRLLEVTDRLCELGW